MILLDGPRLAPASGRPATGLVILIHGYGADGEDLIDIGRALAPHLPDVAFASPHAPEPCEMSSSGLQWFPLTFRDPTEFWRGVVAAAPALDAFIDAERDRLGITDDRIVLLGFSQGCMLALHVGLRRRAGPAAIIGYSGLLAGPENLGEATTHPAVTLIHGDLDQVVPYEYMSTAASALSAAGIPVTFHTCPGLGHGINQRGLSLGLAAIRAALP